jgi:hypothetical protein
MTKISSEQMIRLVEAEAVGNALFHAPVEYACMIAEGSKDVFDSGVLFGASAMLNVLRRLGVEIDPEKLEMPE